nr:RNB domain-containing ribonuclease [Luteimicrobium subarcticum]
MQLPDAFPPEVTAAAREAAVRDLTSEPGRDDLRDVPFHTIDPAGSMDLDQAMFLARVGDDGATDRPETGPDESAPAFVVRYAIADVAAFVDAGGPVDIEAHERGSTLYGPDGRIPLHPPELSEGAASLLPDVDRPAVVWRIVLDGHGEIVSTDVRRAVVRSVARLSYDAVQTVLDGGAATPPTARTPPTAPTAPPAAALPDTVRTSLGLLREIGALRIARERDRGGVSLDVPEQEFVERDDGTTTLELRETLPVESWNAQVSLLTGIAAAQLMRRGGVGILRTLPPADARDVARLRRTARALGIDWPADASYGDVLATLDSSRPHDAAFLTEATSLFRGASYVAFGGDGLPQGVPGDQPVGHAAIAAEYAHVTAPLRRLVDRFGTEACLAVAAGTPVPAWVRTGLAALPKIMARTGQRAGSYERACLDTVEAALVQDRVGDVFDGVVVDVAEPGPRTNGMPTTAKDGATAPDDGVQRGQVVVADPALRAPVTGRVLPLGEPVRVRLARASVEERVVAFELAGPHD